MGGSKSGRTVRAAGRPKLLEFTAEFLSSAGPVGDDVIAKVLDMALDVELILFQPAHVEFLSRSAPLELPGDVLFVVTNYSANSR